MKESECVWEKVKMRVSVVCVRERVKTRVRVCENEREWVCERESENESKSVCVRERESENGRQSEREKMNKLMDDNLWWVASHGMWGKRTPSKVSHECIIESHVSWGQFHQRFTCVDP